MYKIYMDNSLVWTNETPEVGIYAAKVSCKVNSTNALEVSVAKDYPAFGNAQMLKSVVDVYQDDETDPLWEGRPISKKKDFYGNTTYNFEGVLGYLYDSVQYPKDYTGQTVETIFRGLIAEHNSQVESYKQFTVGNITVVDTTDENVYSGQGRVNTDDDSSDTSEDPYYMYQYDNSSTSSSKTGTDQVELETNYESTFDAINNLLINNLAGYLVVRFQNGIKYIDYLKEYLPSEGQIILFGSNLLDYSSTLDYSNLCTGVIPVGGTPDDDSSSSSSSSSSSDEDPYSMYQKASTTSDTKKNKITIESVNGGSKILWNDSAVANYGKIVKAVEWSNVTDPSKLKSKGEKYLNSTQFDNLSLECKVVDLHFVDKTEGPLHHMHMIRVKSEPHGLNKMMPISEMEIDLLNPANDTVKLGATYNSITGELASTTDSVSSVNGSVGDINETISNNNNTAWTNITKTSEEISLEAHKREQSVDDLGNTITVAKDAILKITAEQISSEVSERTESEGKIREEFSSSIKQTAQSITSEVTARKNGEVTVKSMIQQKADSISTQITTVNGNLSSIEQKVDSISTKVTDAQNSITSYFKQTATSFEFGFNNNGLLQLTYKQGDGTTKTMTTAKISADNVNFYGKTMNLGGGTITVTTEGGFKKALSDGTYTVVSTKSFTGYGSTLLQDCIYKNIRDDTRITSIIATAINDRLKTYNTTHGISGTMATQEWVTKNFKAK